MKAARYFSVTAQICFWATLVFVPLAFSPGTVFPPEWGKQFVLTVLVGAAFLAWLGEGIVRGELGYARSILNPLAALLVLAAALSAWFSQSQPLGFLGLTGQEVGSVLNMLGFTTTYFLAASSYGREGGWLRWSSPHLFWAVLLVAAVLVLVTGVAYLNSWWLSFNTIGTPSTLSLFTGLVFLLGFALWHFSITLPPFLQLGWRILTVVAFLLLIALYFWVTIAALVFVLFLVIGAAMIKGEPLFPDQALPLAAAGLFLVLLAGNFFPALSLRFLPIFSTPGEALPNLALSWTIARHTLQEETSNFFWGTGPGTFSYQYGRYRPPTLNATIFWETRFSQGINALATHLVEGGVVGTILLIVFLAAAGGRALRLLSQQAPLALGTLYLVAALFLYPQNFILYFFLFVFAGLLVNPFFRDRGDFSYKRLVLTGTPLRSLGGAAVILVLLAAVLSLVVVSGRRYAASVYFQRALSIYQAEGISPKALAASAAAADLDRQNDVYAQNLSQLLLAKNDVAGARQAAQYAVVLNPLDAQNWINWGSVEGPGETAITAYQRALQLEPNNLVSMTALGRTYFSLGQMEKDQGDIQKRDAAYGAAAAVLERAVTAKTDYVPARLALVQLLDSQKETAAAVAQAAAAEALVAEDAGGLYQLGVLHYQAERWEDARRNFEQAVEFFPSYSNARYFLGLIYERQRQKEKAVVQFEEVARINPNNAEVQEILERLRAGKPIR